MHRPGLVLASILLSSALLAGCGDKDGDGDGDGDGGGDDDYPTLCQAACEADLETEYLDTCTDLLAQCQDICTELTNGTSSACASCITDDVDGVEYYDGGCHDAEFLAGEDCDDVCG